jgi:hypothetical protein
LLLNALSPTRRSGWSSPFFPPGRLGVASILWLIELLKQVLEAVGNPLAQHLVVDTPKDVADSSLILAAEASPGLSHLRVGIHGRL